MRLTLAAAACLIIAAGGPACGQTPPAPPSAGAAGPNAPAPMAERTAAGGLGLEQLAMMERVSDPRLSPDGKQVLYGVRTTDWAGNRGVNSVWLVDVAGGEARRLPISDGGASSGRWSADGQSIYFLSPRGGSSQVWRADRDGQAAVQVTRSPIDVTAFRVSPDGKALMLAMAVFVDCPTLECTRDRAAERSRDGVIAYDALPLRPWDSWNDGRRSHLFVQDLDGSGLASGAPRDLLTGLDLDVPSRPLGSEDEFVLTPDGRTVIYAANHHGKAQALTYNTDLFALSLAGGQPVNLTASNLAPDGSPTVSPDGRRLAWLANRRDRMSGDQAVVMISDVDGSNARALTPNWDRGPGQLRWRPDGRALYATAAENGQQKLFEIDARTGAVAALTDEGTAAAYDAVGQILVWAGEGFSRPTDLWLRSGGAPRQLTRHNAEALRDLDLPKPELFTFAGWNGESVQGWVFKPAGYVEGRKYPVAYLIHGGPKSPWTDGWSYRWNPQTYTGAGYAVVMVNFHGSPGWGQAFTDSINDHWGDRPLEDLQKGWAHALSAYPFLDGSRACALGASYGGYMVNLIAGRWNEPWRCLVNHAGVFNVNQLMNAMDAAVFYTEFGANSWERPELYARFSPETYVGNWTKPMLVLHGSKDFRVPMEQGLATFSALQKRGVESRFVHVPEANHWVLRPRDWVEWQGEILDWTATYTAER